VPKVSKALQDQLVLLVLKEIKDQLVFRAFKVTKAFKVILVQQVLQVQQARLQLLLALLVR
jgi:hypothetical protein